METWDFAHCLPYFKRLENAFASDPEDDLRGHNGPVKLERGTATNPLFQAQVHGLDNVRVVDASATSYVTNGNIHAPVLMLAEKAADIILGRKPLEPVHAEYYRHGEHAA